MTLPAKSTSVHETISNASPTLPAIEQPRTDPIGERISGEETISQDTDSEGEADLALPTASSVEIEPVQITSTTKVDPPAVEVEVAVEAKVEVKEVEEIWLDTGVDDGEEAEDMNEESVPVSQAEVDVNLNLIMKVNINTTATAAAEDNKVEGVSSSELEKEETLRESKAEVEGVVGVEAVSVDSDDDSDARRSVASGDMLRVDFVFHRLYSARKPLMSCNLTDEEILFALNKMRKIWLKAKINLTFDQTAVLEREVVSPDLEESFDRYLLKYPKDDVSGLPWTTRNKGNLPRVAKTLETTIPKLVRWEGRHLVHAYAVGAYVGYNGLSFNSKIYIRTQRYHKSDTVMDKAQFGRILAHEVGHRFGLHHPPERSTNLMVQQRSVPDNADPRVAVALTKSQIMYARTVACKMDVRMRPAPGSTILGETTEQTIMFFPVYRAFMVQQPVPQHLVGKRIVAVRLKLDLRKKYQRDVEFSIVAVKMDDVRCNKKLQVKVIGSGVIPTRKMEKGSLRHVTVQFPTSMNVTMLEPGYIGIRFFRKVGLGVVPRAGNAPSRWPCSKDKNVAVVNFEFSRDKTL